MSQSWLLARVSTDIDVEQYSFITSWGFELARATGRLTVLCVERGAVLLVLSARRLAPLHLELTRAPFGGLERRLELGARRRLTL